MNHSIKKATTLVLSICLCFVSAVSCGDKKTDSRHESGKLTPTSQTVEYAPTDEIKNASLSSGLIQIGNDVFRNGGYYTVEQLMKELDGKYELQGGINLDEFLIGDEEKVGVFLPVDVQIQDNGIPAYDLTVYYSNLLQQYES